MLRFLCQLLNALTLKLSAFQFQDIITNADLKEITQNEDGLGLGEAKVVKKSLRRDGIFRLQVQVGDEIHFGPGTGINDLGRVLGCAHEMD